MSDKKEAGSRRELTDKRKMGIFLSILVTCIVGAMLSTALNTALPQMMVDFGVDASTGQWLSSIYSLVMGIMVLATPFLIRRVPTKRPFLFSIAMFGAGVALSALTSNFTVMMAGRVLQVAGNGIVTALGQVVILTIFPLEKRGQMMGLYGLAIGVSPGGRPDDCRDDRGRVWMEDGFLHHSWRDGGAGRVGVSEEAGYKIKYKMKSLNTRRNYDGNEERIAWEGNL